MIKKYYHNIWKEKEYVYVKKIENNIKEIEKKHKERIETTNLRKREIYKF